jgi:hypothetical protein
MLQPLSRTAIFQNSPFADAFIASMQQSYASDLDMTDPSDRSLLKKFYDHLHPLQPLHPPFHNDMLVLTYPAIHQKEYFVKMPKAMEYLFHQLQTKRLYFVDFLKTSLHEFPFETYRKRNKLKQLLGWQLHYGGFQLAIEDLCTVWPLFYFSGIYARSAIVLIADGEAPLALRLCKDGNFHCNYQQGHEDHILPVAKEAGFLTGDVNLCWDYKVHCLPLR